MAPSDRRCTDCGGVMVRGFTLDIGHSANMMARWIEGDPDPKWWRRGVDLAGRDCRSIVSYRCTDCGLLRSYATDRVKAPGVLQP